MNDHLTGKSARNLERFLGIARNTPRPRAAGVNGPTGPVASGGPAGPGPAWSAAGPPVPSSLTTAARLMSIGGVLSALGAIVGLATVPALKVMASQEQALKHRWARAAPTSTIPQSSEDSRDERPGAVAGERQEGDRAAGLDRHHRRTFSDQSRALVR